MSTAAAEKPAAAKASAPKIKTVKKAVSGEKVPTYQEMVTQVGLLGFDAFMPYFGFM